MCGFDRIAPKRGQSRCLSKCVLSANRVRLDFSLRLELPQIKKSETKTVKYCMNSNAEKVELHYRLNAEDWPLYEQFRQDARLN